MRFLSRGFLKTGSRFSFLLIGTKAYLFRYCITQKFVRILKFLHLSHLKALTLERGPLDKGVGIFLDVSMQSLLALAGFHVKDHFAF